MKMRVMGEVRLLLAESGLSFRDRLLKSSIAMGDCLVDCFIEKFLEVTEVKQSSEQILKIDRVKVNPIKYKYISKRIYKENKCSSAPTRYLYSLLDRTPLLGADSELATISQDCLM